MSSNVFANGHEISAKKDSNRSMGAMPDVCLSPPSPPAGPVPVPYPNFSMGSDTNGGTKKVLIKKKQAGIKNSSDYKKSKGNEAATRSLGMNVITHTIQGKLQHAAWSMDVKFEGRNVIRQLDLTTHNHASPGGGGAVMVNGGKFTKAPTKTDCRELQKENERKQKEKRPQAQDVGDGRTVATGHYSPPSGGGMMISSSSHMSNFTKQAGWAHGYKTADGEFKESKMCAAAKKKLAPTYSKVMGKGQSLMCHAESRILESVLNKAGARPGGTLTLRIQWKKPGKRMLSKPCKHCKKMLCAVQQECGLTIKICRSGRRRRPSKLRCPKKKK